MDRLHVDKFQVDGLLQMDKMRDMNLKEDIENCLARGWKNPHRLAKAAGLKSDMGIRRVLSGERQGFNSKNYALLWPFLYGDRRPTPPEAA